MSVVVRLTHGLREAPRESNFSYPAELLSEKGKYAEAIVGVKKFTKRVWPNETNIGRLATRLSVTLIHECEQAKSWVALFHSGNQDYETARLALRDVTNEICNRATRAINELIECDRIAPYWIRNAFAAGMAQAVSPECDIDYVIPDQSRDDGGLHVKLDGERRRAIETQFGMRASLVDLDVILKGAHARLIRDGSGGKQPWHQVANIRYEPPLSRKARASLVKDHDAILGAALVGLALALSAWFRHWSAHKKVAFKWVGTPIEEAGFPCWAVVAEFLNAAFGLANPETAESVRQRAHSVSKGRVIRVMNWPGAAIREPQIQRE